MRSKECTSLRNEQVARILSILRDLDRLGGTDVYELAERYGTAVRTIRRDLAALEHVGLPLAEEQDGKRKRWSIRYRDRLQEYSGLIDASHYLALKIATEASGLANTSGQFAALEDLARKIEKVLGPAERDRLKAIERCFDSYSRFAYREAAPDVFWPLVDAVSAGRVCRVVYRAPSPRPRDKTFEVLPLRLFVHDRAVYVLAFVPKHEGIVKLNLQRLRRLRVLKKTAKPPADFDPAKWEQSAFGIFGGGKETTYVLRFHRNAAPFIRERVWHPSQTLRKLRGGGVELTFTCPESFEVAAWVASWREWVEARAPRTLRSESRSLGEWLCRRYSLQPTSTDGRAAPRRSGKTERGSLPRS